METLAVEKPFNDEWYFYLTGEHRNPEAVPTAPLVFRVIHKVVQTLPGDPRCFECNLPLSGFGAALLKPMGYGVSSFSPKLCNLCEQQAKKVEGGAEVPLSLLFVDIRGSSGLAEGSTNQEFARLIQRFYRVATDVLVRHDGMVNRLMGDQVIGLFVPRFFGPDHSRAAIDAAREILTATGHGRSEGPWVPAGAGVHMGPAFVGAVGTPGGVNEIAVLGSAANLAARLSSTARAGEIVVSEQAAAAAGLPDKEGERRLLELKGLAVPVPVRVLRVADAG